MYDVIRASYDSILGLSLVSSSYLVILVVAIFGITLVIGYGFAG